MKSSTFPPVVRAVSVSWTPDVAFQRFTGGFDSWWPVRTHSVGGRRVRRVVFEQRVSGRIYEEHLDGRRFQWGQVSIWDPPRRVCFTWHPAKDPSTAQDVEVTFTPEGSGTTVTLVATGWERWGEGAHRARKGYSLGWAHVLDVFAGRRTPIRMAVDLLIGAVSWVQRFRGGPEAEIARAKGEISPG